MNPIFFAGAAEFRRWLEANHLRETELWVGYYKKATGKPSLTWPIAVDEALCFGWIDGLLKSIDGESHMQRFTPRKAKSNWSAVNIRKMQSLIEAKRVSPAGMKAWEARDEKRSEVYSFERKAASLTRADLAAFRKNAKAWKFWEAQPPGYRRVTSHYVTSAKRPETRAKRLAIVIADSAAGRRIGLLERPKTKPKQK